jgi:hypothetical protein
MTTNDWYFVLGIFTATIMFAIFSVLNERFGFVSILIKRMDAWVADQKQRRGE